MLNVGDRMLRGQDVFIDRDVVAAEAYEGRRFFGSDDEGGGAR